MVTKVVKPMLASDAEHVNYPVLASTKLDGIRCLIIDGVPTSRNGKPIRNRFVQAYFKQHQKDCEGLDGELIVGDPFAKDVFQVTTSGVMSSDGQPNFQFYVFDYHDMPSAGYRARHRRLLDAKFPDRVLKVEQVLCNSDQEMVEYEEGCLSLGYEGLILRDPDGRYKYGRSTAKEGLLLKVKKFSDSEAEVVGFEELMSNQNPKTKDVFGDTERSSHKAGMVPMDTLGALVCRHTNGQTFGIGTGFDQATRKEIWTNRKKYLGKLAKYKHLEISVKDLPRFPVFLGWRDANDL